MRAALLGLLLLLVTVSASLAAPELVVDERVLQAGTAVELRWTTDHEAAEEVEIELALAGGGWRRISPELEAHEGRFVWRIPSGLAGEARIRLRYGDEHGESVGREIALRIEPDVVPHAAAARARLELPAGSPAGAGLRSDAPVLRALASQPAATSPRNDAPQAEAGESATPAFAVNPALRAPAPVSRRFAAPRRAPLRN